ncbi:hypothetical protein [Dongshaea marina]|uniref:hypothetical protein n=1 Tax=Dongshaea marina TaxID=2047966 RepID=UPI00131EFE8B|nr:hypothetical protein [Dongshaea marina]
MIRVLIGVVIGFIIGVSITGGEIKAPSHLDMKMLSSSTQAQDQLQLVKDKMVLVKDKLALAIDKQMDR